MRDSEAVYLDQAYSARGGYPCPICQGWVAIYGGRYDSHVHQPLPGMAEADVDRIARRVAELLKADAR